jgi:hypothetical protein
MERVWHLPKSSGGFEGLILRACSPNAILNVVGRCCVDTYKSLFARFTGLHHEPSEEGVVIQKNSSKLLKAYNFLDSHVAMLLAMTMHFTMTYKCLTMTYKYLQGRLFILL